MIENELTRRHENAKQDAAESHAEAPDSYCSGYDAGYRDALFWALWRVRKLNGDE